MKPHLLTLIATTLFSSALAYADELPQDEPIDRRDRSRVGVTLGLFTPTGELGVEYAHALHPNVEIAAGAGVGLVRVGPQLALMPRARLRRGPVTLSLGAGVSGGRFNNISPFEDSNATRIMTLWGNAEAGVMVSSKRGPFARFALGASKVLAHGDYNENNPEERMELEEVLPYGGLTVGWLF